MSGRSWHRRIVATLLLGCTAALLGSCGRLGGPYQRGQQLLASGDAPAAADAFSTAIASGNEVAKAYAWRCYANLAAGRYDLAVADCTEGIDRLPADAEAPTGDSRPYDRWELLNNRAVAHLNLDRPNEARSDLDAAIELKPDYAEAYANRGRLHIDGEDWEQALADLDRAIQLNPSLAEAYGNRGRAHEGLGDGERALADYSKAIELSQDSQAFFNRGMLFYAMGDFDSAYDDFKAVVDREPEDSYLRFMAQQQVEFLARRPTGLPGPTAAYP